MRHTLLPGWIVLLALACSSPDARGSQASPPGQSGGAATSTDFKVVVWYSRDRPLETFKYQIYDVRKGEYTPAVDAWLQLMRTKYTSHYVTLREVNLADEKGKTEMLKVGAVVKRELAAAAAMEGVVVGYGLPGYKLPTIATTTTVPVPAGVSRTAPPGGLYGGPSYLNPPGASFPFPVPYPRPHP